MRISQGVVDEYKAKEVAVFSLGLKAVLKKDRWKKEIDATSGWQTTTNKTPINVQPTHNAVGLLTGDKSGVFVLDIDDVPQWRTWLEQNSHTATWQILETSVVTSRTASGGLHFYFLMTDELRALKGRSHCFGGAWSFDSRTTGNFVFAPPTSLKTRDVDWKYEWVRSIFDHPLTVMPEFLVRAMKQPANDAHHIHIHTASASVPARPSRTAQPSPPIQTDKGRYILSVVQLFSVARLTDYNSWISVGWKLKELGLPEIESFHIFRSCSTLSEKSDEVSDWRTKWNSFKIEDSPDARKKAENVLIDWAKGDNPVGFEALMKAQPPPLIPEEKTYAGVKQDFEKTRFHLKHPTSFVEVTTRDMYYLKIADFKINEGLRLYEDIVDNNGRKQITERNFLERWLKDVNRRSYETVDFLPPPVQCPSNVYNFYPGLRGEKLPKLADGVQVTLHPLLGFISHLCGETSQGPGTEYLLSWLASIVQYPGTIPGVAIVMRSPQGCGKNLFANFFGTRILGESLYGCSAKLDSFFGTFSTGLAEKLLVCLNEVDGAMTKKILGEIKESITDEKIAFERKGIQRVFIRNFARQLWFTNNTKPIHIEQSDRRFVAFEIERVPDRAYFRNMVAWMDDDTHVRAFYDFLKARDLSSWDAVADRPTTTYYRTLQRLSLTAIDNWMIHEIESSSIPGRTMTATELLGRFNSWGTGHIPKFEIMTSTGFGLALGALRKKSKKGIIRSKDRNAINYQIDLHIMREQFVADGKMDPEFVEDDESDE